MAEDDDWEGREGRWTRSSESSEGGGGERYYELPDGEIVQGEPEGDVEAEPVEPPEEEEGGLAGLFGGDDDDDEPDEEIDEEEEDDDGSILPIVAGVVVLLLVLLVLLVGAAYLGIADPLGIGGAFGGDGADDGGGGENGDGGGGNETELFSYPVNWSESSFDVTGHASGRAERTEPANTTSFDLTRLNVTQVTFTLRFNDTDTVGVDIDGTSQNTPDTLQLNVTSPDNETKTDSGSGVDEEVTVTVSFDWATIPASPSEIVADSRDNATAQLLADQPASVNGTGTYAIEVWYQDGGDACVQSGDATTGDCSEDWTLDVSYSWYDGILGTPTKVES